MFKYLGYFGMPPINTEYLLLHLWLELETGNKYLSYFSNLTHPQNVFIDIYKVEPTSRFIKINNAILKNKALIAYRDIYQTLPQRELLKNWETSACFKDMENYDYNIKKLILK